MSASMFAGFDRAAHRVRLLEGLLKNLREPLELRRQLLLCAYSWTRVQTRVERDFFEAFEVQTAASAVSASFLDRIFAEDPSAEDAEELDALDFRADELDEFAKIAGAIVLLVIDEQLRRVYKAVGVVYGKRPAGPLVGDPLRPPNVHFSDLVHAGANSFRHLHQWEDLSFNYVTRQYEQGNADDKTFREATQSIDTLAKALGSSALPLEGFPTLRVLRALSTDPETYAPEWKIFRQRFLVTVRDVVCDASHADWYDFVRQQLPDAGWPARGAP